MKVILFPAALLLATALGASAEPVPFPAVDIHSGVADTLQPETPDAPETPGPTPGGSPTPAGEPPAEETPEIPHLVFKGFLATSYNVNPSAVPKNGQNAYQGYTYSDRKLRLDGLNLDFEYGLNGKDQVGARFDTVLGSSYPRVDAAAGLFRNTYTGYSNTDFDIRQAFVRYTTPGNLQIDVGKFATHFGYEIMPGVDGINPHGTSAYGYTYNPFTSTGLRLQYPINDQVSVMACALLGADRFTDNNKSLSFGGSVNWHPTDKFSLIFNILDGPEQNYNASDRRRVCEAIVNYKALDWLNLGFDTYATAEENLRKGGGTGHNNSYALYMQTQVTDKFAINLRQEFFNDPDGLRLGTPAYIRGFTITPSYQLSPDWNVRVDFRFDKADTALFDDDGKAKNYQNQIFFQQSLKF